MNNTKGYFKFLATFDMIPKANLIVYYIRFGRLVSDRLEIEFRSDLPNVVSIIFKKISFLFDLIYNIIDEIRNIFNACKTKANG